MALLQHEWCPLRRREDRDAERERCVTTEAETGRMQPQAKEDQRLMTHQVGARKGQERTPSYRFQRVYGPVDTLISEF